MGISLGLVGLGSFGSAFAKLFKSHPLVDRIGLCDCEAEKLHKFSMDPFMADKLSPGDCYATLDEICRADFDALVIITQPWLHAPQCIQALEHGKSVYSAVPVIQLPDSEEILDWCARLKDAVKKSGKHYMLGETTVYRPQTMFCRRMAQEKRFGDFVYAEGEYAHDVDHYWSLREVMDYRTRGVVGSQYQKIMQKYWDRNIKASPMFYPTHSVSGPLSVMQTRALKVSAGGFRNRTGDDFFANDEFSNVTAMFYMENGAMLRISELREVGCHSMDRIEAETFRLFGTSGSFAQDTWEENFRSKTRSACRPIKSEKVSIKTMRDSLPPDVMNCFQKVLNPNARPGDDFEPDGHGGSHPFLVHEFCSAVAENRSPLIDIEAACSYMAMGVAAHQSALKDGELIKVQNL